MKFSCKTQNLKEAIFKVERIVSRQTTLPILGNILIKTENGRLSVTATNLEIAIKAYLGAKIEEAGEITVPGRILSGFLSSVKDEVISGKLNKTTLEITSEKHKLKINGIPADDFPIIPKNPKNYFLKIKSGELLRVINSVLISVAKNDTRQELNGIFIQLNPDSLLFASTDSFRLSEARIKLEKDNMDESYLPFIKNTPSVIVPALTFMELVRVVSSEEEISFMVDQNQFFIKNNSFRVVSRLINGDYPEYQQILPKQYDMNIKVNKEELLDALKIASLVLGGSGNEVKIESAKSEKTILVSSQSEGAGDNLSRVAADSSGGQFEVIFNCRYLMDGLSILGWENGEVILKLNKEKSPVLIRELNSQGEENKDLSYVVMPIIKS